MSFAPIVPELDYLYVDRGVPVKTLSKVFNLEPKHVSSSLVRRKAHKRRIQFEWGYAFSIAARGVTNGVVPPYFQMNDMPHVGKLDDDAFANLIDELYCFGGIRLVIIRSVFNISRAYTSGRVNKYKLTELKDLHETYEALTMKCGLIKAGRLPDTLDFRNVSTLDTPEFISTQAAKLTNKPERGMMNISKMPLDIQKALGLYVAS